MSRVQGDFKAAQVTVTGLGGCGRRRAVGSLMAVLMAAALLMGGPVYAARPIHTSRRYWIGRNISEAEKEFGTPTFSEQLVETGGLLVIYARRKDSVHFVFETDPGGKIIKAARIE